MRFFTLCFLLLGFIYRTQAAHIVGGEVHYEYLGNDTYKITVKVYCDCFSAGAPFDPILALGVFNSNNEWLQTISIDFPGSTVLPNDANNPCLLVPPTVCVEEAIYETTVVLPPIAGGYTLAYQRCCRNNTIVNLSDPSNTGAT